MRAHDSRGFAAYAAKQPSSNIASQNPKSTHYGNLGLIPKKICQPLTSSVQQSSLKSRPFSIQPASPDLGRPTGGPCDYESAAAVGPAARARTREVGGCLPHSFLRQWKPLRCSRRDGGGGGPQDPDGAHVHGYQASHLLTPRAGSRLSWLCGVRGGYSCILAKKAAVLIPISSHQLRIPAGSHPYYSKIE